MCIIIINAISNHKESDGGMEQKEFLFVKQIVNVNCVKVCG